MSLCVSAIHAQTVEDRLMIIYIYIYRMIFTMGTP